MTSKDETDRKRINTYSATFQTILSVHLLHLLDSPNIVGIGKCALVPILGSSKRVMCKACKPAPVPCAVKQDFSLLELNKNANLKI